MKRGRFRRQVARVAMRLVGMFEASFRQIFGFNEEALLQVANDTCCYANGQGAQGAPSSSFWRFF